MRKSLALLICMGVVVSSSQLEAITTWSRIKNMSGWGVVAGTAAYFAAGLKEFGGNGELCPSLFEEKEDGNDIKSLVPEVKSRLKSSAAAASVMAAFVCWATSYCTATHRYKWAIAKRSEIENKTLFGHEITSHNFQQISIATGAESTPLSLVTLHLELANLDNSLSDIKNNLEIAGKDAGEGSTLGYQVKQLLDRVNDDLLRIRSSQYFIKNDNPKLWQRQWEMHKGTELKEKEIAAMHAPQMHYGLQYHFLR